MDVVGVGARVRDVVWGLGAVVTAEERVWVLVYMVVKGEVALK